MALILAVIKTKSSLTSNAVKLPPSNRQWGAARAPLAFLRFGLGMIVKPDRFEEVRVLRRRVPIIGFVAALGLAAVPSMAHAQVNIDQGKTPAEIFASDCAVCHKTTRGLADGKNSLMLSTFLREHYTASRDQAAALAAYVLGAGGNGPAPGQKPGTERTRAAVEEPKTGEPRTAVHPARPPARPEEEAPAAAKLQRPTDEEPRPATASRGHKQEPEPAPPAHEPAAAAIPPASNERPGEAQQPAQEFAPTKSAAAPTDTQPGDSAPVPRDKIPN